MQTPKDREPKILLGYLGRGMEDRLLEHGFGEVFSSPPVPLGKPVYTLYAFGPEDPGHQIITRLSSVRRKESALVLLEETSNGTKVLEQIRNMFPKEHVFSSIDAFAIWVADVRSRSERPYGPNKPGK